MINATARQYIQQTAWSLGIDRARVSQSVRNDKMLRGDTVTIEWVLEYSLNNPFAGRSRLAKATTSKG